MRGKEASSDTSAEGLPAAGRWAQDPRPPRCEAAAFPRRRAAKTRRRPRRLPRVLRAPVSFGGGGATACPAKCRGEVGDSRAGAPRFVQRGLGLISFGRDGTAAMLSTGVLYAGNNFPDWKRELRIFWGF